MIDKKEYMRAYLKNWRTKNKDYQKKWIENNKEKHNEYIKKFKIKRFESRRKAREGQKCNTCGYNEHWEILQFHHIDRNSKVKEISAISNELEFQVESKKCILLCPNCHWWLHTINGMGRGRKKC